MTEIKNFIKSPDHYSGEQIYIERLSGIKGANDPLIKPLVPQIINVMKQAFGRPDFSEKDMRNHIGGDVVLVAKASRRIGETMVGIIQKEVIGYASLKFGGMGDLVKIGNGEGAYLAAAVVDPRYQERGVYKKLTRKRIETALEEGVKTIFTRTQNPQVERGIRGTLEEMGVNYVLERILIQGAYGEQLTRERPKVKNEEVQHVYEELDYNEGDAFVLVFRNLKRR